MARGEFEVTSQLAHGGHTIDKVKAWTFKIVDGCLIFDNDQAAYGRGFWIKVKRLV